MKQPRPWFRKQNRHWYVEIGGVQHNLGPHPEGAPPPRKSRGRWNPPDPVMKAFHALMASAPESRTPPRPSAAAAVSVGDVCDAYLESCKREVEPKTWKSYRKYYQSLCDFLGIDAPAADVTKRDVTRWLDAHPSWKGSARLAVAVVKRAFRWASDEGCLLNADPLRGLKQPRAEPRSAYLTRAECSELLAAVTDPAFRLFAEAMVLSGCRPSEVAKVTARDVDLARGTWTLGRHKTSKRTGRPRVVRLAPRLMEITKELCALRPRGPLFLTVRGRPFRPNNVLYHFGKLRERLPWLAGKVPYTLRHSFVTNALLDGVGIETVSKLVGHSDSSVTSRFYSHIDRDEDHLREQAARAAGTPAGDLGARPTLPPYEG